MGGAGDVLLRQQEQLHSDTGGDVSEDEDDPLDAFMAGIQASSHLTSVMTLELQIRLVHNVTLELT